MVQHKSELWRWWLRCLGLVSARISPRRLPPPPQQQPCVISTSDMFSSVCVYRRVRFGVWSVLCSWIWLTLDARQDNIIFSFTNVAFRTFMTRKFTGWTLFWTISGWLWDCGVWGQLRCNNSSPGRLVAWSIPTICKRFLFWSYTLLPIRDLSLFSRLMLSTHVRLQSRPLKSIENTFLFYFLRMKWSE